MTVEERLKAETQLLGLLVHHPNIIEKWLATDMPPLSSFSKDSRPIAELVANRWREDGSLLTSEGVSIYTDTLAKANRKRDAIGLKALYSSARQLGYSIKPDTWIDIAGVLIESEREARIKDAAYSLGEAAKGKLDIADVIAKLQKVDAPKRPPLRIRTSNAIERLPEPPILIEGLLRKGEIANLVASPKMKKSWMVHDLAHRLANGGKWLGRFECRPSKVLLVDNELHGHTLGKRLDQIKSCGGYEDGIDYVCLRDEGLRGLDELMQELPNYGSYDLIIFDALYRFYPAGFDENSNSHWTQLYNELDGFSRKMGCAIINVHHSAKGTQQGKSVTDTGAGGGAQSRAADAHIVLRAITKVGEAQADAPEQAELAAVVRAFPPVGRLTLQWAYPFWTATDAPVIEQQATKAKPKRELTTRQYAETFCNETADSRETIEQRARDGGLSIRASRDKFAGALAEGWIVERIGEKTGKGRPVTLYRLASKLSAHSLGSQLGDL
ncbi:MAG TPA: AAA family ATPase [Hymenobacter sp.]|jgi:hypothetical protein